MTVKIILVVIKQRTDYALLQGAFDFRTDVRQSPAAVVNIYCDLKNIACAKNSFLLDFRRLFCRFGRKFEKWKKKRNYI